MILTVENARKVIEELWAKYGDMVVAGAFDLLAASLILVIGVWFSRRLGRATRKLLLTNPRVDSTIASFGASAVRYGLLAAVFLAVLNQFGVETTSLVAVLGAATLAIGLALQGTLSNVAAGVMLVLFRPYRLADDVQIGGVKGTVEDISLFTTELSTLENVKVVIPNGKVWGETISNYSARPTRRIDAEFGVSYDDDLRKVERVLREVLAADTRIHRLPEPFVKVKKLADWSVIFAVRASVDNAKFLDVNMDLNLAVREAFLREGITIPFPVQTSVHIDASRGPEEREM